MDELNETGRVEVSCAHEERDASGGSCKVERIMRNLEISRESMTLSDQSLMEAENNYKLVKRRYDKGACDSRTVSEALESLSLANVTNHEARYNLQIAMIGLEEILLMDIEDVNEARNLKQRLQDDLRTK